MKKSEAVEKLRKEIELNGDVAENILDFCVKELGMMPPLTKDLSETDVAEYIHEWEHEQ